MQKRILKKQLAAFLMAAAVLTGTVAGQAAPIAEVSAAAKVSETKARNIAANDARVRTGELMALDSYEDTYNGRKIYHISFYIQKGNDASRNFTHYVYYVNRNTGAIEKKSSRDLTVIKPSQAIRKALDKADVSSSKVKNKDFDYGEDGEYLVYDIEFSVPVSASNITYDKNSDYYRLYLVDGTIDYEFTINAVTGKIIDWDSDDDFREYYY